MVYGSVTLTDIIASLIHDKIQSTSIPHRAPLHLSPYLLSRQYLFSQARSYEITTHGETIQRTTSHFLSTFLYLCFVYRALRRMYPPPSTTVKLRVSQTLGIRNIEILITIQKQRLTQHKSYCMFTEEHGMKIPKRQVR